MQPTIKLAWDEKTQSVSIESEGFTQPLFMAAVCGMAKDHLEGQAKMLAAVAMQQQMAAHQQEQHLARRIINGRG